LSVKRDQEILGLLKSSKKREQGFALLLDDYQERVYWQVRKMTESHEDAADITQEVWSKVVRYIDGFQGESGIYTWLYRIAHNETMTFLRKQKHRRNSPVMSIVSEIGAGDVSSEDIWSMLQSGIKTLPEKQRIVFELRYFEEMPYRQMSEELGTSEGALKASYHIAVKKIEAHVKKVCWT